MKLRSVVADHRFEQRSACLSAGAKLRRELSLSVWLRCTIVDRAALITPLMTPRMMLNIANFLASAATDEGVSRDASMSEVK